MSTPIHRSGKLDQLKSVSTVVADTGEIEEIKRHRPVDATTNPSLLLKAAQMDEYAPVIEEVIAGAKGSSGNAEEIVKDVVDRVAIKFGAEILKLIPGRVSVEVDARLSFDAVRTLEKARKLIGLFDDAGIGRERVLIKIASTWEGIQAARTLEKQGINCNLTLLFGFAQAKACADAGVFLVSPFVGRILDWHKKNTGLDFAPQEDPGVLSVTRIYNYYKKHGFKTVVMGASFRNIGEIQELAGCDRLTISPTLLNELQGDKGELPVKLTDPGATKPTPDPISEAAFRWEMNEDAMATEKLAEGIRGFARDQETLETLIAARLRASG
jgi:transaldolase